jgi:GT2 family glycosyltransferase
MKNPLVSLIVISYNNKKDLNECLTSLKNQDYENFEIVLVDNNSSDNSVEIAKGFKGIKIIENKKNEGFAKGNNLGIKNAFKNKKVKYIVCINPDTITKKSWLKELVSVAEENKLIGSVQSKVLLNNNKTKINSAGNNINFLGVGICGSYMKDKKTENKIKEIGYASGCSVLYSREALEKVGLYDEDFFMYKEDLDLGWRLSLFGYKNLFAPKSIVYHKYSFSKKGNKFYYLERNRLIVLLKNYKIKTLFLIFPLGLFFEIGMILYSIKGKFFLKKVKGYAAIIKDLPKIISKRIELQKNRKINDSEIIKQFIARVDFEEIKNPILEKIANPIMNYYWRFIKRFI